MRERMLRMPFRRRIYLFAGLLMLLGVGVIGWNIRQARIVHGENDSLTTLTAQAALLAQVVADFNLRSQLQFTALDGQEPPRSLQAVEERLDAELGRLVAQAMDPEERRRLAQLQGILARYDQAWAEMAQATAAGVDPYALWRGEILPLVAQFEKTARAQLASYRSATEALHQQIERQTNTALALAWGLLALYLLLGSGLAWLLTRAVACPLRTVAQALDTLVSQDLRQFVEALDRLAQGDLTARFSTAPPRLPVYADDEFGSLMRSYNQVATQLDHLETAFEKTVANLAALSSQIQQSAHSLGMTSSEMLSVVNEHTAGTSQQSAAITQVTATVEEVRATAEQTANLAREVAERAQQSVEAAQQGQEMAETLERSMQNIYAKMQVIAQDILALSERTQQIGEITATSNDIADQSNLLALNAAIEAAKAGDQGKGFTVVATEMRNLAEQAKAATHQIQDILGEIQKATNAAVMATEQGAKGVEEGMEMARRTVEVIQELSQAVEYSTFAARQIAASAQQQNLGMDQIAQAIRDIQQATDQFVASARQSQSSAQSLETLARQLVEATKGYQLA